MWSLFRTLENCDIVFYPVLSAVRLLIYVHPCLKQMHKLKYNSPILLLDISQNIRKWHLY